MSGAPWVSKERLQAYPGSGVYSKKTLDLVAESIVVDLVSPIDFSRNLGQGWWQEPNGFPLEYFDTMQESGITIFNVNPANSGPAARQEYLQFLASANAFINRHAERLSRIVRASDFERAKRDGRIGILIGAQNSDQFQTTDDVQMFFNLGQRVSQLTYNSRNNIGNGSTERRDDGLSDFGVAIVDRMNTVGMAVDVSHCGDQTTLDAFEVSVKPVLITHSNCRALNPGHPRCKTDEAILRMAKTGGVFGITNVRMFVRDREPTTIEHVLDHYDHAIRLIGADQVAVGSDADLHGYDAIDEKPLAELKSVFKPSYGFRDKLDIEGLDHPRKVFDLTEGLLRRGHSAADVKAILGGNAIRVLGEIWGE